MLVLLLSLCSSRGRKAIRGHDMASGSGGPYDYGKEDRSFRYWTRSQLAPSRAGRFRVPKRFTNDLLGDAVGNYASPSWRPHRRSRSCSPASGHYDVRRPRGHARQAKMGREGDHRLNWHVRIIEAQADEFLAISETQQSTVNRIMQRWCRLAVDDLT